MQQFSRSLPMMLYRALAVVVPRFRLIFNEFGLTEQQWRILRVLREHEKIAFSDLARLTLIPRPSLVGILDRLRAAGLVLKRRSNQDRRNVFVMATPKGIELLDRISPRVQRVYDEFQALIDEDTWKQLINGLEKISRLDRPDPKWPEAVNE